MLSESIRSPFSLRLIFSESHGKESVWAIFFNIPAQQCIDRIKSRRHHPTLPPQKGSKVVAMFSKMLEPRPVVWRRLCKSRGGQKLLRL